MGLIAMSERDLQRIEVLSKVVEHRMTIVSAAHVLALSPRQVRRLLERLQAEGAAAIRHKARGRPSNNRISSGVRDYALELYLQTHGCPVAFYSDKHSVFRVARQEARNGQGMTQFGRALSELSIEILCANSSQAKGRVERANRTLQDRLVKELRLAGVATMDEGNAFLPGFMERYNARFARIPVRPADLHRPLNLPPGRLQEILCRREQRYVGAQLTFSYERKRIMLEENDVTRGLAGRYVDTYAFADGRLEVRWKGHSLSYTVFDKDQRVTHAAITENKRLGEVLAYIKERQDQRPPPKVKTNSEKTGYKARGPRTDVMSDPVIAARREQALARLAAAE